MHVEDVHEHAYLQRLAVEIRVACLFHHHDATVGGRQDRVRLRRNHTRWIAEELDDEHHDEPHRHRRKPPTGERQREGHRCRYRDEQPAFASNDGMWIAAIHRDRSKPVRYFAVSSMRLFKSCACCWTALSNPRARSMAAAGARVTPLASHGAGLTSPGPRGPRSLADLAPGFAPGRSPYVFSTFCARTATMTSANSKPMSPSQPRCRCGVCIFPPGNRSRCAKDSPCDALPAAKVISFAFGRRAYSFLSTASFPAAWRQPARSGVRSSCVSSTTASVRRRGSR